METLVGWWTRRAERTHRPTAQCIVVAVEQTDGAVIYRRHLQSFSPWHGKIEVRHGEKQFATLDDLIDDETFSGRREVRAALEACWAELCEPEGPSFAPRAVREYWFAVAWNRFLELEPTFVVSDPVLALDPDEPDVTGSEREAVERLRGKFESAWDATVTPRPLREGEEPSDRLLAVWTVSGLEDDALWSREVAVLTDGHEVFARDAEMLLPYDEDGEG